MNNSLRILVLTFAFLFLHGCTSIVKEVDYKDGLLVPEEARPAPIKFSGVKLLLPPGMDLGYQVFGGSFCTLPRYPVNRNVIHKAIDEKFLRQSFHDAMEANGYDVTDSIDILFAPEDEDQRGEYSIAGKIKDVHVDMCSKMPTTGFVFFTRRPGEKGELYVHIDWSVYDRLRRTVVYKTRTEGYTNRRVTNQEGLTLMFNDAFEMAVHNLAADPQFFNLIVHGVKPEGNYSNLSRNNEKFGERPRLYGPDESVHIPELALSRQPFKKEAEEKRKVAVMLQKSGHGSGFFITKQGHILSNAHVVGDALRMRVVTADKKEKLVAEVLRIDKARDVALLKLEEIPEGMEITTLPIRTEWPSVGEDIYAVGVPKDYRTFQSSVTKGIVSAHRKNMKVDGVRMELIQGDVEVHPGNSGGPLIDEYGNIIGISVLAYQHEGTGIGLNLFIPIAHALDILNISLEGRERPAQEILDPQEDLPEFEEPLPLTP